MDHEDHLQRHIELCKRVYERLKRNGSWPWRNQVDSPNSGDMVESEDQSNTL